MTFKVGDLARCFSKEPLYTIHPKCQPYLGQVVEIVELNTKLGLMWGYYHTVKAQDGFRMKVSELRLEKIDPPREDLKVVDWETVPWQPTVMA